MKGASAFSRFVESIVSPDILIPNVIAAAVLAVMNITTAISIAALVFSGSLSQYLPTGIGLYLVGTVVGGVLVAALSGYKAVIAGPRSGQAPLFASMAAGISLAMHEQSGAAVIATVIVGILATTLFISVVIYTLGWAKLGGLVRYIPYPVMGGFFAGLGYLLLKGGMLVTLGPLVSPDGLLSSINWQTFMHLLPAVVLALVLYVLDQRIKHWLLMPTLLASSLVMFYLVLYVTGTSVETAAANAWLPAVGTNGADFVPVITFEQLELVDWTAILGQSSTIFVIALMSVIMLLLDTSGIEIAVNRDIDPNRELKAAGLANVANGLSTGVLCIQAAADTAFVNKLGGTRFIMVLFYAAFVGAVIFIGPAPIAYVPTLMLGGLLMYIGLDFLMSWVWNTRKKLPVKDFAVICGILLVVAFYGILEGVAVGVILAILLFVHSYSQLSVIKSNMTGAEHVSNVDRDVEQTRYLDSHGEEMQIIVLQGFLFFGTASRLLEDIRNLLDNPERSTIRFLVLDFNRVDAVDTSAANSFAKLIQICSKANLKLVFTGCAPEIAERFAQLAQQGQDNEQTLHMFGSLDEGVAWCGDKILEHFDGTAQGNDSARLLAQLLGDKAAAKTVSSYFKRVKIAGGKQLFKQGDPGDALYLILDGSISVVLDLPNGQTLHLRTMRSGAILGEMALYTGAARSASALVNEDCVLLRLNQKAYRRLTKSNPVEAGYFHTFIVRLMAERLGRANREIMALSR